MPEANLAGHSRKRPQLYIKIDRLHLDNENPRLPEEKQGKSEPEILTTLFKEFFLDELAESMAGNGYFDEEPLVAIPQKLPKGLREVDPLSREFKDFIGKEDTQFTVVEGNRRLATAKLLLDSSLRGELHVKSWPNVSKEIEDGLRLLPVIIYRTRDEVVPYLGVRHIVGIQKWESYAKARYIAKRVESGSTVEKVAELIGGARQQETVHQSYLCYQLLEQAKEVFDVDIRKAKEYFSFLLLAVGQRNVKTLLGLPKRKADTNFAEPVPKENLDNLKNLISWLYGDGKQLPVIRESRDITDFLSHIVASPEALAYLESHRDLEGAYDRTDGEEKMLIRYLRNANSKLEAALGIAHRHRTAEVVTEAEKCEQTAKALVKSVREQND